MDDDLAIDPRSAELPHPRRRLFGLDFIDLPDLDRLVDDFARFMPHTWQGAGGRQLPVVVTPNVDQIVRLERRADAVAAEVVGSAAYVLPDGQPIVWASRLLGKPLSSRLAGSSLVAELFPRLQVEGRCALVIAASEEIARRVDSDAGAAVAIVAPMLTLADRPSVDEFVERCVAEIETHRPTHVFVCLGFPKQCNLIAAIVARLRALDVPCPLFLAVGASFDMHFGLVRRAPLWVQRWGLEWFYRFLQEPRRLFRRYFVDDPRFVGIVWREWRSTRTTSEERSGP